MDIHTYAYVKLLLSPRHNRGITHFIYKGQGFFLKTCLNWHTITMRNSNDCYTLVSC